MPCSSRARPLVSHYKFYNGLDYIGPDRRHNAYCVTLPPGDGTQLYAPADRRTAI